MSKATVQETTGSARLQVNGAALLADPSGALWWPERRTLVVADLHLEKGSAFAARGRLLPPYDTAATLARLSALMAQLQPDHVIALGDSFHDWEAARRLAPQDLALLAALLARCRWTWIAGNHDPLPPPSLGGELAEELVIGALRFRHEAALQPSAGEISGHYHPKARVRARLGRIGGRCFVGDGRRLVLPAFGAFAGGLDVLDPAIRRLFPEGFRVALLGRRAVYDFPLSALAGGG